MVVVHSGYGAKAKAGGFQVKKSKTNPLNPQQQPSHPKGENYSFYLNYLKGEDRMDEKNAKPLNKGDAPIASFPSGGGKAGELKGKKHSKSHRLELKKRYLQVLIQ